jgi:uncharacterized protein (DUF58 family)
MPEPLVDRELLEKLERLTIHWQKSFPGLVGGHNTSRFSGAGQEFLDHRHFHHGDDLRAVNWRAYMRLEKLFLKMFQVEPRIPVRLLLDVSQSMTTGAIPKFDYARKLAAALCYVGLVRLETITVQPFADHLEDSLLCGGGRHRFAPSVDYLMKLEPHGRSDFLQTARQFASRYSQRGLVLIISDFLDDADCLRPVQFLADLGHEIFLVHIWSSEDREPPWDGPLELMDAETGQKMEIAFESDARQTYVEAFDAYARSLQELALRKGGRYVGVSTDVSVEDAIFGPMILAQGVI